MRTPRSDTGRGWRSSRSSRRRACSRASCAAASTSALSSVGLLKRSLLRLAGRAGLLRPAYRAYESAQALRGRRAPPVDPGDGLPVPPPQLVVRVAGTADAEWFLERGRRGASSVRDTLARQGVELERIAGLLDFGCGCGRVIRNWIGLEGVERVGTDLNPAAVDWCRRHLPFARFDENGLAPPLPFEDDTFELV